MQLALDIVVKLVYYDVVVPRGVLNKFIGLIVLDLLLLHHLPHCVLRLVVLILDALVHRLVFIHYFLG